MQGSHFIPARIEKAVDFTEHDRAASNNHFEPVLRGDPPLEQRVPAVVMLAADNLSLEPDGRDVVA